jgi:hypothetical protein
MASIKVFNPFYAACCFDELSRGFVLSWTPDLKQQFHNAENLIFLSKMDDHGVHHRWGNMGWILAKWLRPVASKVARDLPYWVMRLAP